MADDLRFENRMSDSDALMWTVERDPMLRSTITAVAVLDRSPDRERLLVRADRGSRQVPRLRQRVVSNPFSLAPPRWEFDPNFDLDYHVRFVRAPGEGSFNDVLRLAEPIAMQGFDRARPLWEMVIVDGLADDCAALILKIHHAITDGVGMVKIATVLFDLERDPTDLGPEPEAPPIYVMNQAERFLDAFDHERRRFAGVLSRLPATLQSAAEAVVADRELAMAQAVVAGASVAKMLAPAGTPGSPIMRNRSLSVHFDAVSAPIDEMKSAAKRAGGKLNDAFVAAVLGGFRRYHDHHGVSAEELRMAMPINVRSESTADVAGNQFAPTRFLVPLTIDDPVERMKAVQALVTSVRAEPAMQLIEPFAGLIRRLPGFLSTSLFGSMLKGVDFTTSNVPGVPFPLYCAGAQLKTNFAFGPVSGAAANVTLVSYLDQLHVGVNTDAAAVPDPDVLLSCLQDGFAEVRKVA